MSRLKLLSAFGRPPATLSSLRPTRVHRETTRTTSSPAILAARAPMSEKAAMTGGSVFDEHASRKLEAAYQTPDVIAQRQETLRALALRPSERVLDIGAGPGLLVAEMAQEVGPSGHVTGLEISDSMLALSRRSEEHTSELQSHSDLVCRLL